MIIVLSDKVLFHNIRHLRAKYRLSRQALAKLTGISVYTLRDMESEAAMPCVTDRQLHRLCAVFNVSAEEMIHTEMKTL